MPDHVTGVRAEALQMSRDLVAMIDSEGDQMTEAATPHEAEPDTTDGKEVRDSPYAFGALAEATLDAIEVIGSRKRPDVVNGLRGIQTGFSELDGLTGGLTAGTLTVIASRPAMGRTTLACDFTRHAAVKDQHAAGFLTLQEPLKRTVTRIKAAECRIMRHHLHNATMDDEAWKRLARRMPDLVAAPLYLRQMTSPGPVALSLAVQEWAEADKLKLLVIDGLEDIPNLDFPTDIGTVARTLKKVAVDLDIPIIVTAQVHRLASDRYGKVPHLDDVDDTVAFVADNVILLHREDAYQHDSPRAGETDLIVSKHRQGPPATITVAHQLHYSRFVDMAQT
jgi:replicative DNA helicase